MYTRVKQLRTELGLSREEFGSKVGVSGDVINNIERNRNKTRLMSDALFHLICDTYNVNEDWLRTGDGEMFRSNDDILASITQSGKLSTRALFILERFMDMPTDKQDEFIDNIRYLLNC